MVVPPAGRCHAVSTHLSHPLGQSRSAPGGRQLVGQAVNLTFEFACNPVLVTSTATTHGPPTTTTTMRQRHSDSGWRIKSGTCHFFRDGPYSAGNVVTHITPLLCYTVIQARSQKKCQWGLGALPQTVMI